MSFNQMTLCLGVAVGAFSIIEGLFGGRDAAVGCLLVIYCQQELKAIALAEAMNRLIREKEVDLYRRVGGE